MSLSYCLSFSPSFLARLEQSSWNYSHIGATHASRPRSQSLAEKRSRKRDHIKRSWMSIDKYFSFFSHDNNNKRLHLLLLNIFLRDELKSHLKQKPRRSAYFILNVCNYSIRRVFLWMNEHIFHPLTIGVAHLCLLILLLFSLTHLGAIDRSSSLTFYIIDSSSRATTAAPIFRISGYNRRLCTNCKPLIDMNYEST